MQGIDTKNDYYTYEEACRVLDVSYAHLARAINSFSVFHPVHIEKGAKKHLLKSEVDAMVGKQLFTQRKPKKVKMSVETALKPTDRDLGSIVREEASHQLKAIFHGLPENMGFLKGALLDAIKESEAGRTNVPTFRLHHRRP